MAKPVVWELTEIKLQVTLGRAFIIGFGFMLGVGAAALLPGLIVLIVAAAAAGGD